MSTETFPYLDIPRLAAAVRVIDAHPERWRQTDWGVWLDRSGNNLDADVYPPTPEEGCRTAFCVCGWLVHQEPEAIETWMQDGTMQAVTYRGSEYAPEELGRKLLGITGFRHETGQYGPWDATSRLFVAYNNRVDVQYWCLRLAELAGAPWPVPLPAWAEGEVPNTSFPFWDGREYQTPCQALTPDMGPHPVSV